MKIKDGRITILVGEEKTRIEIKDANSGITFLRMNLDPEQFCALLSRQANVECEMDLYDLESVGKKLEHKSFDFKVPHNIDMSKRHDNKDLHLVCDNLCPGGWKSDNYYGSKSSFFEKNGEQWARTTIRRWV